MIFKKDNSGSHFEFDFVDWLMLLVIIIILGDIFQVPELLKNLI